jgi:hypothetical protein
VWPGCTMSVASTSAAAPARRRVARGVGVSSREQVDEAVGAESCDRVHNGYVG